MTSTDLPIAVIGAGPIGLAAAAHLIEKGTSPVILEAGERVGANILTWAHVRVFSPWAFNVDSAAARLLESAGWIMPPAGDYPTGNELVRDYLEPLAALPELRKGLRLGTRVIGVSRVGRDRLKTAGRDTAPFVVHVATNDGEERILARAVIDCSGTVSSPNPLGADGLPAAGERALAGVIHYGMPDVLGRQRLRYIGRRTLVVGSGHSAFTALLDLAALAEQAPGTRIVWAVRRAELGALFGGGEADALPERGRLGQRLRALIEREVLTVFRGFRLERLERTPQGVVAFDGDGQALPAVDEIVAATGFRPDFAGLSELRLALDPIVESPAALASVIDPNVHSCGTVPPHGEDVLRHPEAGFYVAGMKSYGRATNFLMLTGYEQVRSIACALTGDTEGARRVALTLPETGVCNGPADETAVACCGGPASVGVEACCVLDAEAKAAGAVGCGCGTDAAHVVGVGRGGAPRERPRTEPGELGAPHVVPLAALRGAAPAGRCCG